MSAKSFAFVGKTCVWLDGGAPRNKHNLSQDLILNDSFICRIFIYYFVLYNLMLCLFNVARVFALCGFCIWVSVICVGLVCLQKNLSNKNIVLCMYYI